MHNLEHGGIFILYGNKVPDSTFKPNAGPPPGAPPPTGGAAPADQAPAKQG